MGPCKLQTTMHKSYYYAQIFLHVNMVYSRGTTAFDSKCGSHEFDSPSFRLQMWESWVRFPELALKAGDQTHVRKAGFFIVARVLRPCRWPRHCWAQNLHTQLVHSSLFFRNLCLLRWLFFLKNVNFLILLRWIFSKVSLQWMFPTSNTSF